MHDIAKQTMRFNQGKSRTKQLNLTKMQRCNAIHLVHELSVRLVERRHQRDPTKEPATMTQTSNHVRSRARTLSEQSKRTTRKTKQAITKKLTLVQESKRRPRRLKSAALPRRLAPRHCRRTCHSQLATDRLYMSKAQESQGSLFKPSNSPSLK